MDIRFDEQADALYIQFQTGKAKETIKLRDGIMVDIGKDDKLFGIEILDVSKRMPIEQLGHLGIDLPIHA